MQVLSELVYASTSSEGHMMCMDQNLTAFADSLGTCERLVKTPLPLSYTRYTLMGLDRLPAKAWFSATTSHVALAPHTAHEPA